MMHVSFISKTGRSKTAKFNHQQHQWKMKETIVDLRNIQPTTDNHTQVIWCYIPTNIHEGRVCCDDDHKTSRIIIIKEFNPLSNLNGFLSSNLFCVCIRFTPIYCFILFCYFSCFFIIQLISMNSSNFTWV